MVVDLYCNKALTIVKGMKSGGEICGTCSMHERDKIWIQTCSRKPEGKRKCGRVPPYT
jgi:hypothetical protein